MNLVLSEPRESGAHGDEPPDERLATILAVLEELRPGVQRDGGDIEFVALEPERVKVRLKGACTTCALASQTLGGVRRRLVEALGTPIRVVPAVD